MSLNQSRFDNKTDQHFRKPGGARNPNSSAGQHRPYFSGRGRGAVPAPGPTSNPRSSYKKSNNVQGGNSKGILSSANLSDSNSAIGVRNLDNGATVQSNLHGASNASAPAPAPGSAWDPAPAPKPADVSAQRSSRPLPRAPSSQSSPVTSDSTQPSTPAKGDEGKGFSLQFGSLSPGFMNGMQVPARTYSAPPNLDEQKCDQARRDSVRAVPPAPLPSVPKQEVLKKDAAPRQQAVSQDNHAESKARRDVQVVSTSSPAQTQKPSAVPMPGIAMSLPFHQPTVPMQFGPNPQIQSQGMAASSLQMPIQMPLQMGNPSQVPQQVFVSGLQHHLMQTQGIMHQGQNLGFNSQMGTQIPHQLGHLGMNMPNQFNQQQAAKFVSTRKPVKITHPDTREELRLDNRDGSSSGSRPHHSGPPQSQSLSSYKQPHPVGYFSNSYNAAPPFFPAQGSLPLSSSQLPAGSQGPRYNYPVSQPPSSMPFVNQSVANTVSVSTVGTSLHANPSSSSSDYSRIGQNAVPSAQLNSTTVNDKAISFDGEVRHSDAVSKVEPPKSLNQASDPGVRKDVEVKVDSSSHQSKVPASVSADASAVTTSSAAHTGSPRELTCVLGHEDAIKRENEANSTSVKDGKKLPGKEGHPEPSHQVSGQAESTVFQASVDSCKVVASESAEESKLDIITSGGNISSQATAVSPAITDGVPCDVPAVDLRTGSSYFLDTDKDQHMSSQETINRKPDDSSKHEDALKKADDVMEVSSKESESCTSLNEGDNMGTQSSSLDYGSSNVSDGCSVSDSNSSLSVTKSLIDKDNKALEPTLSGNEATSAPVDVSDVSVKHESDSLGDTRPGSSSGTVSNSNKTAVEANKSKNNKGKKKLKEMLQKADALGTTSDIYMAYKGPEEKKETIAASEVSPESNSKEVSVDTKVEDHKGNIESEQSKTELDDWEDAADISTPKLQSEGAHGGSLHDEEGAAKKYSRDFLLTIAEQCVDLPEGFEITSDIEALMCVNVNATRGHEHTTTARIIDRPTGPARADRRGNGTLDADRWNKQAAPYLAGRDPGFDLAYGSNIMGFRPGPGSNHGVLRHPRAQGPVQLAGGVLAGPMHPMGFQGMQQNNSDADRWQRAMNFNRGLMPAPLTPMPVMHKADKKYEVGKITDEEQAKQRKLKGILNKLTPQNFEKLFEQVKEVNIDNVVTLTGVISQIFDKALTEPTFCEMYANFCYHLASELPDLSVDDEKITFKRLLLNKCQEEFERGEREEQEANKADGEGEIKQSEEEREEKRLKVRRRMLGNIRLIGELYKKKMLTERIMHECIKKLLGQYQNPDEENIEALCKLMSTIGEMIDHPKAKEYMDAYFDIMGQLSTNMKLSSRVRFMLRDAIDLRKNKWQQRRKVEGPKKIEEVHRDAAQERMGQSARLSRGPSMNSAMRRGQPLDFGPRGSMLSSPVGPGSGFRGIVPQVRGYVPQGARMDERNVFDRTPSVPLTQRLSSDEPITLGPQGGLARGMAYGGQPSMPNSCLLDNSLSFGDPRRMGGSLNGYSSTSERGMYGPREEHLRRLNSERSGPSVSYGQSSSQDLNASHRDLRFSDHNLDRSRPKTPPVARRVESPAQNISSEEVWPEERLRNKSIAAIKEYYSAKDEKEVALCIKDLNAPSFYSTVVSIWVTDSFERKDMERELLAKLLVSLSKPREGMFSPAQLIEGFGSVLNNLEDTVTDAPKAPEFLGRIFGRVVLENVVPLKEVGQLIHQGGEEQGSLVEAGLAGEVLGSVLEMIKIEKGEAMVKEMRAASHIRLDDFRPTNPNKSGKLEMFM